MELADEYAAAAMKMMAIYIGLSRKRTGWCLGSVADSGRGRCGPWPPSRLAAIQNPTHLC